MGASAFAHEPLPYVVVLRYAVSEDDVPTTTTRHVVAYSVSEAVMQAALEIYGTLNTDMNRITIESVAPDVPRWTALMLQRVTGEHA